MQLDATQAWLKSQHNVSVPEDWLLACLEWAAEECAANSVPSTVATLNRMVFDQWLISDLREIGAFCLPSDIVQDKNVLNGTHNLQIQSMRDASTSCYSQLQKLKGKPSLVENLDHTKQVEAKPSRTLIFELCDGRQIVKAIEHRPLPQIPNNVAAGAKIQVKGQVLCRKGVIFLRPENVSLLGGEVEGLTETASLHNILHQRLYGELPATVQRNGQLNDQSVEGETEHVNAQQRNPPIEQTIRRELNQHIRSNDPQIQNHRSTIERTDRQQLTQQPTQQQSRFNSNGHQEAVNSPAKKRSRDSSAVQVASRTSVAGPPPEVQMSEWDSDDELLAAELDAVTNNICPQSNQQQGKAVTSGHSSSSPPNAFLEGRDRQKSNGQSLKPSSATSLCRSDQHKSTAEAQSLGNKHPTPVVKIEPIRSLASEEDKPFTYLSRVLAILQHAASRSLALRKEVTIKCYISTVLGKVGRCEGKWSLPVKVNDGTAALDVVLSNQVMEPLIGLTVAQCEVMHASGDPSQMNVIKESFKQCQQFVRDFYGLMTLRIPDSLDEQLSAISLNEMTLQHVKQLHQRVQNTTCHR